MILAFFANDHYLISKISPKWRTQARITLRRWEKVHNEAWNLYFQERYIWNLYQRLYLFRWTILYLISQIFTEVYNLVSEHSTEKRQVWDSTLQPVLWSVLHWEALSTILAFSVNDPLISQIFPEMDYSLWEHATEKRWGSHWSLEPVLSGALHMEPLSTNFVFKLNDPLPVLPNSSQDGQLGLGTRYGAEIGIILKLRTRIFRCAIEGTFINDFSISVKDPLPDLPNYLPKWITRPMNTLRRKRRFIL